MIGRNDLRALRAMIEEARLLILQRCFPRAAPPAPENCWNPPSPWLMTFSQLRLPPLLRLAGAEVKKTTERGPEHFRQLAAMRKTRAGGRPRKEAP